MGTNNIFRSELFKIHNIVQASMLSYPKEIIIETLRDFFSKDAIYFFNKDQWGFSNTTDHTDLVPGADMPYGEGSHPEFSPSPTPTRIFIGESYRYNVIHYPAVLVKSGGNRYVPISINRNQGTVQWEPILYQDGYNSTIINRPKAFITAGAWEGSIVIDVLTRGLKERDEIVELISMCFTEIYFNSLYDIGVIIKPISIGAPTEQDDRNDKLFRQSLTLDIRTEWERSIPISSLIDAITFTVEFANLDAENPVVAQNLTINTELNLIDNILNFEV